MLLPLLLLACGASSSPDGDSGATSSEPVPTWHQDVAPIVQGRCLSCHEQGGGISGIALHDYESARSWASAIGASVASGTMPPWSADPGCAEYEGDLSLTADQIDTVVRWAEGDAPEGDPGDPGEPLAPLATVELDRIDMTIEVEPYTPVQSPDDYRCFLVEWPEAERSYVEGFHVRPDTDQVHHVIAFLIEPGAVDTYRALDEADEGPGYACYGGPGGDIQTLIDTRWLGGWAPGGGANRFPEGTGIRVEPGSMVALQVHYYSPDGTTEDHSAIDLQVSDTRDAWGDLQPWTEVAWLFGDGMEIPAGESGVQHSFEYTLGMGESFAFHDVLPHMHTLGRSIQVVVERADGTEDCMLSIEDWDFDWQRTYALKEPVRVSAGDTVRLTCTWDNPTDQDVAWGDGTGDEMCLATTYIAE